MKTEFLVRARHAVNHVSPNRMHDDGLPQKLGFRGALVLGAAIYGNMIRSVVAQHGENWLENAEVSARFLKPVCSGDQLRVAVESLTSESGEPTYRISAFNETVSGELAATLETVMPDKHPLPDPKSLLQSNEWIGPVTRERSWDLIEPGKAYRLLHHTLQRSDNLAWAQVLEDCNPIFLEGATPPVHPAQILLQAAYGASNQFRGDNAVHASSRIRVRKLLRAGDEVTVLTVPAEKWERKGNHWITLYGAVRHDGDLCAEIYHTQIFRLRDT